MRVKIYSYFVAALMLASISTPGAKASGSMNEALTALIQQLNSTGADAHRQDVVTTIAKRVLPKYPSIKYQVMQFEAAPAAIELREGTLVVCAHDRLTTLRSNFTTSNETCTQWIQRSGTQLLNWSEYVLMNLVADEIITDVKAAARRTTTVINLSAVQKIAASKPKTYLWLVVKNLSNGVELSSTRRVRATHITISLKSGSLKKK